MRWHFKVRGGHTHVRVFMNGGKCGDLCFRNDEFTTVQRNHSAIQFINEDTSEPPEDDSVPLDLKARTKA